jgi:ribosomal protein S18 acetylase RimI-like enzyme
MIPRLLVGSQHDDGMSFYGRLLEPLGVICRWRAAMGLSLEGLSEPSRFPDGYTVATWDPIWLDRAGEIDQRSYAGTVDAALYGRYFRSVAGSRQLWHEALRGRFGRFDTERSLLLLRGGEPCGHLMACMRTAREGFIGNLAVLPEDRGGTGRALLLECLWRYRNAGVPAVSLAVTLDNRRALSLYESLGFKIRYKFPVVAFNRPPVRRPSRGP